MRQPRWRTARRQAMKDAGILAARRQWIWLVEPDRLFAIPGWAREAAVKGLAKSAERVWLWPVDAKRLRSEVSRSGWRCRLTRAELRHCGVCARPLIGTEAERRRKMDEAGPEGRQQPCGAQCEKEAAQGVWRALNPSVARVCRKEAA